MSIYIHHVNMTFVICSPWYDPTIIKSILPNNQIAHYEQALSDSRKLKSTF